MPGSASFQRYSYSGLDPLLACDVVYGGHFEHRLVSARPSTMVHQRLTAQCGVLETGGYDFPVVACGVMPKDMLCIGVLADGAGLTSFNTAVIDTDEIQIYRPGAEVLYQSHGSSRWITFVVPESLLQNYFMARFERPLELPRRDAISIRLPSGGRAYLTRLADDAFALGRSLETIGVSDALADGIFQGLLDAYANALSVAAFADRKRMSTAQQHLQLILACERIALTEDVLSVDLNDIARRSGYSRRALELIFKRTTGMPPGRWFMNIRLNGVMRDLLTAPPGFHVMNIAARWGFMHLSRFAYQYRRVFGELPSQTLQRAQGR